MSGKNNIQHRFIIAVNNISGCGPVSVRKICDYFRKINYCPVSADDFMDYIPDLLVHKVVGVKFKEMNPDAIEKSFMEADRILSDSKKSGIQVVSIYDEGVFPSALLNTKNEKGKLDIPMLLYFKGNLSVSHLPSVAIIGTREATEEGLCVSERIGEILSNNDVNIVSGLALGCDTAGHNGALKGSGSTTAFLAHGLDTIFPSQNRGLAEHIIQNGGLLLSEYPIGTPVTNYNLVKRDRLQAGLASATIVIQTGINGGTMHAAMSTLKAGKPLFVVKYKDMSHSQVQGNIYLAEHGAKYISPQNSRDILDIIDLVNSKNVIPELIQGTLF